LRYGSLTLTAVLVDAGFFLKRATHVYGRQTPEAAEHIDGLKSVCPRPGK